MKEILFVAFLIAALGCSNGSKSKQNETSDEPSQSETNTQVDVYNLKDYYFPLNDSLQPTTYKYEVLTKKRGEDADHHFEYVKFERNSENTFTFTRFENDLNLIDSMVFRVIDQGADVLHHYIKTPENTFVEATVTPSLLFPWQRELNGRMTNAFNYTSKINARNAKTSIRVNNGFVGLVDVENGFTPNKSCAKLVHQTEAKFTFTDPPKVVNYTSKGEILDLKGVGVFQSIETNNHGDTTIKRLVDITVRN